MARWFHNKSILLLLIVLTGGRAQIFDFFQGFQPIVSYQTLKPIIRDFYQEITTKKPKSTTRRNVHTTKPPIFFDFDTSDREDARQVAKEKKRKQTTVLPEHNFNFYSTTVKPLRKTTKSSQRNTNTKPKDSKVTNPRLVASNQDSKRYDTSVFNNIGNEYNTPRPSHDYTYTKKSDTAYNYDNNFTPYNYDDARPIYNSYTTSNPFYNPGVKPAVVDNRPPITNRPITSRPYTARPQTSRPTTKTTPRPIVSYPRPTDEGAILFPDEDLSPQLVSGPDEDYMTENEKRRYIDLAEKMCDKYRSLNMKKLQAIPLLPSPDPVQVTVSSCTPSNIPLVVGGKVVSIREFPHMALLGWKKIETGGYSWKCGGSLISDQYVLTAAHCAYQERDNTVVTGPPRVVQLGSSYFDDPGALVVPVSAAIRHPKYKASRSYYDVALLKLVMPVTFSEVVKPACLGVPPPPGSPIIATGWGHTKAGGNISQELRSVSLPIWDIDECSRVLGTSRKLPNGPSSDSQLCAGERRGGKDTCQGDSGGPAQIQDGCLWRVVAVTSVGRSCAAPNTPGLYSLIPRAFVAAQVFGRPSGGTTSNSSNNNNNYYNTNNNYNQNNKDQNSSGDWSNSNRNQDNNQNYGSGTQNYDYNRNQNNNSNRQQNNNYNPSNNDQSNSYTNQNNRVTNSYNNANRNQNYDYNNQNNRNQNKDVNTNYNQGSQNSNSHFNNQDYRGSNDRSYETQNHNNRNDYSTSSNNNRNNYYDGTSYNQRNTANNSQNNNRQGSSNSQNTQNNSRNNNNNNNDYLSYSSDYVPPSHSSHPIYEGKAWWTK